MNKIDDKYNLNLTTVEDEKEFLMKSALEVFDFISKNQNKILRGMEENIEQLRKEEDAHVLKLKSEKINENKDLEKEINKLENKINSR